MLNVDGLRNLARSVGSKVAPEITLCVPRVCYPVKQGEYIMNISKTCDGLHIAHSNFGQIITPARISVADTDRACLGLFAIPEEATHAVD